MVTGGWGRLIALLAPERGRAVLAVLLLVLTIAAGVGLTGTSAWLLSKAALHPSIAALSVAVVGVRAFGISRATLRYLERLASHDVTLRLLARLRVAVRFWDVPPGSLLLDGEDARAWPSDCVREAIAFAAQRAHLFTGTWRDNLALAAPGASETRRRAALAAARLDELVARLPEGLDTWIGEQGLHLSGGERQRPALARALLKDGPFLLLDEPTAHLDAPTVREAMREIVRAGEGRATLLVTHRLVGLEAFDEVLVLDRGRVVERGLSSAGSRSRSTSSHAAKPGTAGPATDAGVHLRASAGRRVIELRGASSLSGGHPFLARARPPRR